MHKPSQKINQSFACISACDIQAFKLFAMKKTLLFLLLCYISNISAQSLSLDWFARINTNNFIAGKSVAANNNGESYSTGVFVDTADFDPDPNNELLIQTIGFSSIFIQKLDNHGDLLWIKTLDNPNFPRSRGMGLDIQVSYENGNEYVYILGAFDNTVDFNPGTDEFPLSADSTIYWISDIFLLKLDSNGNFIWAKKIGAGGNSVDIAYHFAIDTQGNLVLTGFFNIPADYYSLIYEEPYQVHTNFATNMRIIKLNPNGVILWDKILTGNGNVGANGIAVDSQNNVLIAGNFAGTIDFDPSAGVSELTSQSEDDVFIEKLDTEGNFIWVKQLAGNISDGAIDILADSQDDIYTLGYYRQNIDFDPSSNDYIGQATNNRNAFVLKLDSCGNFQWVDQLYDKEATDIHLYNDKLLICFNISTYTHDYNVVTMNDLVQLQHGVNNADTDMIILQLNTDDGSLLNQKNISGYNGGIAFPYKMCSYDNHVLLIGHFNGDVDFNPSPTDTFMQTAPLP